MCVYSNTYVYSATHEIVKLFATKYVQSSWQRVYTATLTSTYVERINDEFVTLLEFVTLFETKYVQSSWKRMYTVTLTTTYVERLTYEFVTLLEFVILFETMYV